MIDYNKLEDQISKLTTNLLDKKKDDPSDTSV